ncbi:MAG: cupin domain-containing protein [Candidatus Competibacteraceae bacterium]|nr:cupin domain-containing protein [Candidatus Competibacteraceae bacterium]
MNTHEVEQMVSDYVLGTLADPELAQFEAILSEDPVARQQVAIWERRLTPLAGALPEATPRASVWEAIEAALDAHSPPNTITVRAQEGEWRILAPGVEIKLLLIDQAAGFQSFLLRLAPGCQIPAHDHRSLEECLLLEGDMIIGDRHYAVGDYHAALPGSRHPPLSTHAGGVVFLRSELRPEFQS